MPSIRCLGCGGQTNTTLCDYIDHWIETGKMEAVRCYARWEDGQWVKGCGYDDAHSEFAQEFAEKIIAGDCT